MEKPLMSIYIDTENKKEYIKYREDSIKESKIGTFLVSFLNCDFNNYDDVNAFLDKYLYLGELAEIDGFFNKKELEKVRAAFSSVVNYVYNLSDIQQMDKYTPFERYYTLNRLTGKTNIEKYSNNLQFNLNLDINELKMKKCNEIDEKAILKEIEKKKLIHAPYFISSDRISNILYISLKELLSLDKLQIKKCKNCGKYFIPLNRADELFCNNIYKDGKTCKQIGFWQVKKRKLAEDDVAKLYRNTYQQKLLRVRRNPENKEYNKDLEKFRERYKLIKEQMKEGSKTEKDFKKWIISVKNDLR